MNNKSEKVDIGTAKKRIAPDEQIVRLSEKIEKLKRQKEAIENREKEKARKIRTRRLIANGALAEKYLGCEGILQEDFEVFLKKIVSLDGVKKIIVEYENGAKN